MILEDFSEGESFSQFWGKYGVGAEHMQVCMVDRILKMLKTTEGCAAVIISQYYWENAFDKYQYINDLNLHGLIF